MPLKAKPTTADTSQIRVQRLRPRDVERPPELVDRFRPPALEPTAAAILACRGFSKFNQRVIHQLLLRGETVDYLG